VSAGGALMSKRKAAPRKRTWFSMWSSCPLL
jgi:hypothetical protein